MLFLFHAAELHIGISTKYSKHYICWNSWDAYWHTVNVSWKPHIASPEAMDNLEKLKIFLQKSLLLFWSSHFDVVLCLSWQDHIQLWFGCFGLFICFILNIMCYTIPFSTQEDSVVAFIPSCLIIWTKFLKYSLPLIDDPYCRVGFPVTKGNYVW